MSNKLPSATVAYLAMVILPGVPQFSALGQSACCFDDSTCRDAPNEAVCGGAGGVFLSDLECAGDPCGEGGCCADSSCGILNAYSCITLGRVFGGAGTTCADDPCGNGVGACCQHGDCGELSSDDCAALGGIWLGAGIDCQSGGCDLRSCCFPGKCVQLAQHECVSEGGVPGSGNHCTELSCEVQDDCPSDSLFSQSRDGPASFSSYLSELTAGKERRDNFWHVVGSISRLRWHGIELAEQEEDLVPCDDSSTEFAVTFFEDVAGEPGSEVCAYAATAGQRETEVDYQGYFMKEYDLTLPSPCVLTEGWIAIVGVGDPHCRFYWISSDDGDQRSYRVDGGHTEVEDDLSFCLLGSAGDLLGACCEEATGECADNVSIDQCAAAGQRFAGQTSCSTLHPPCRQLNGGCCFDDGGCSIETETGCSNLGGRWLGPDATCAECPPGGACCFDVDVCALRTEVSCAALGHTWTGPNTTCDDCFALPDCPADSLLAHPPEGPSSFLMAESDQSANIRRWDDFQNVVGSIEELTWWGFELSDADQGAGCAEPGHEFHISFHEDVEGVPSTAATCSHVLAAAVAPTGIMFGGAELTKYHVTLPDPCVMAGGWISIVGTGDPDCWFWWCSSGPGQSYCDGCTVPICDKDLSMCLTGTTGGVLGACCDDSTGVCEEDIDSAKCTHDLTRFMPATTCRDFDPSCGVILGACCLADGTCAFNTEAVCATLDGNWQGAHVRCDDCPCVTPCPGGATEEAEPICSDEYVDVFNGGCDAVVPAFSPLSFCEVICGQGGLFRVEQGTLSDLDWYEVVVDLPTELTWTVEAEFPVSIAIVGGTIGCEGATLVGWADGEECTPVRAYAHVRPGIYWLMVRAREEGGPVACGAQYTAKLTQTAHCPGDYDGDQDVDSADFAHLPECLTGPYGDLLQRCDPFNLDGDSDIDLHDVSRLMSVFSE